MKSVFVAGGRVTYHYPLLIAVTNEKLANLYTNEMVSHINECFREWHYLLVAWAVRMELVYIMTVYIRNWHFCWQLSFGVKNECFGWPSSLDICSHRCRFVSYQADCIVLNLHQQSPDPSYTTHNLQWCQRYRLRVLSSQSPLHWHIHSPVWRKYLRTLRVATRGLTSRRVSPDL